MQRCPAGDCDVADDPYLDAREAHPLWLGDTGGLLHVRALQAHHASARPPTTAAFDLWRIPGRKRLDGADDTILTTSIATHHTRILLTR